MIMTDSPKVGEEPEKGGVKPSPPTRI